jgi:putative transposase
MLIAVPRDRARSFDPVIISKGQTCFVGFDDKIISLYARGMTTREIQGHLEEIYGVEVSPTLVSTVTEAVSEEVKIWQNRPLDAVYPIVSMDAIRVKGRANGHVMNKAVYLAIGITMDGVKEVLGMWVAETEGSKFWLQVVTELRNRGVLDIFIACVDGLKGFPEAKETDTTKALESLNMSSRKVARNRGSFPNDESMFKLLYLALNNIAKKWTIPIRDWKPALNCFSIIFGDRMPTY